MIKTILRAASYFKFGWTNKDLNFDSLVFLIQFKVDRLSQREKHKKTPDHKVLQCYKICNILCQKIIYNNDMKDKQKKTETLFKIITLYGPNW